MLFGQFWIAKKSYQVKSDKLQTVQLEKKTFSSISGLSCFFVFRRSSYKGLAGVHCAVGGHYRHSL